MRPAEDLILLFAKFPSPGRVKTRLAASIGMEKAAILARYFLLDVLAMLQRTGVTVHIYFTPPNREEEFTSLVNTAAPMFPQSGADLGERMDNGFRQSFAAGFSRVLLVGSDLPDLPSAHVKAGFAALRSHQAVLAPCPDGGYHMIGFTKHGYSSAGFRNMTWGTGDIFAATLNRLEREGLRVRPLPSWPDIDYLQDLEALLRRAPELPSVQKARRLLPDLS